jgi:hypothetical protein
MSMMQRFRNYLTASVLLMIALLPALPAAVSAQVSQDSIDAACEGLGAAGENCDNTADDSIGDLVGSIVEILSWVVGVISIIMLIIGGLKFITSNGNAQSITSARSTVIYALVGVAVAVAAQVLVNFVVDRVGVSTAEQQCRDTVPRSEWHTCD